MYRKSYHDPWLRYVKMGGVGEVIRLRLSTWVLFFDSSMHVDVPITSWFISRTHVKSVRSLNLARIIHLET